MSAKLLIGACLVLGAWNLEFYFLPSTLYQDLPNPSIINVLTQAISSKWPIALINLNIPAKKPLPRFLHNLSCKWFRQKKLKKSCLGLDF
jgi:hypothetical protein